MTLTVVVLGAGAFGGAAALELAARGHAVTLVVPGAPPDPRAASHDVAKAVRVDYGGDPVWTPLAERALEGWRGWNTARARRGACPLLHEVGVLFLTAAPLADRPYESGSLAALERDGHPVERLAGRRLAERFGVFAAGAFAEAYTHPRGGWAASASTVAWLVERAREHDVEILAGWRPVAWRTGDGRRVPAGGPLPAEPVTGVVIAPVRAATERPRAGAVAEPDAPSLGERVLAADRVVVAAGAWTPALLPHLSHTLATTAHPLLHFVPPDPRPFAAPALCTWAADITVTGLYGFPLLPDGTVKVARHGTGRPLAPDAPREIAADGIVSLRAELAGVLPDLARAELATARLCLYTDTPDGRFLVDADPERPGLVVATGGSGHAFKFAPVLGDLVADIVEADAAPEGSPFAWRRTDGPSGADPARSDTPG